MGYRNNDVELRKLTLIKFLQVCNILDGFECGQQLDLAVMMGGAEMHFAIPVVIQHKQRQLPDIEIGADGEVIDLVQGFFRKIAINSLGDVKQCIEFQLLNLKLLTNFQVLHSVGLPGKGSYKSRKRANERNID